MIVFTLMSDHQGELAVKTRRHELVEHGIFHRLELAAEGQAANRLRLDEEDLRDEHVAAGELVHQVVQERNVLRLQGVPPGGQPADVLSVLEEQRALVAIDGELGPKGDVLIGVFVDDRLFQVVRASDHHLADAFFDEVHDPHGRKTSLKCLVTAKTGQRDPWCRCSRPNRSIVRALERGNQAFLPGSCERWR